jgi:hypothetical protein
MTTSKTPVTVKALTGLLDRIRADQREQSQLEEDTRPSPEEQIEEYSNLINAAKAEYEEFLRAGWHEHPRQLISPYLDDTRRAFFGFQCFHFSTQMIETFKRWRRADGGGMSRAERAKAIATLKTEIAAQWQDACDLIEKLKGDSTVVDWPSDMPPAIFLGWDEKTKTMTGHRRLVELHQLSENERAANDTLRTTLERISQEEGKLAERLRLMDIRVTPAEQIADIKKSLGRCKELQRAAQARRDTERAAVGGSLALYAHCREFLRGKGVGFSDSLLLLGSEPAATPFIEQGPPRINPLTTRVHVV